MYERCDVSENKTRKFQCKLVNGVFGPDLHPDYYWGTTSITHTQFIALHIFNPAIKGQVEKDMVKWEARRRSLHYIFPLFKAYALKDKC